MSPPPQALDFRVFRADRAGLSCRSVAFPRGCPRGLWTRLSTPDHPALRSPTHAVLAAQPPHAGFSRRSASKSPLVALFALRSPTAAWGTALLGEMGERWPTLRQCHDDESTVRIEDGTSKSKPTVVNPAHDLQPGRSHSSRCRRVRRSDLSPPVPLPTSYFAGLVHVWRRLRKSMTR